MVSIQEDVDLAGYNTYALPGRAAYLAEVESADELREAWEFAQRRRLSLAALGSGSNVIVDESGYRGLVVINRIRLLVHLPGDRVAMGAGTELQELMRFTEREGLSGVERLAGIPGTVGGAIYGNAGAFGVQVGDLLEEVSFLDAGGELQAVGGEECRFSYRSSAFKRGELAGIIISAVIQLRTADPERVLRNVLDTLAAREGKHPAGASCGSFFKNIEAERLDPSLLQPISNWLIFGRIPAGRLIEEAGGKGLRVGGAHVSEKHCNFLLNDGSATSADLKRLAQAIKARVRDRFGIELEEEVRYL